MRQVLVIDDEMIARRMLMESICWEAHGYRICAEAVNGRDGLEKTMQFHPDLIFVDIKMPVMDGLEFLRQIQGLGIRTKVVMLTCYNEFDYAREAMRLGAVDYLTKHTFEPEELESLLKKLSVQLATEDLHNLGMELLGEDALSRIVRSDLTDEEIDNYVATGVLPFHIPRFMLVSYQLQDGQADKQKKVDRIFDGFLRRKTAERSITAVYPLHSDQRHYLVIFASPEESVSEIKKDVRGLLLRLSETLSQNGMIGFTGITWKLYIGWKSLPQAVRETNDASLEGADYLKCSAKTIMALEYIKEHYASALSLEEIAEHAGISRVYLSQSFKKETGKNISTYITEYRVRMAKNLLLTSNLKIYTISELCGFGSTQYFNKIFKKMTGFSPNQFKNAEPLPEREEDE